MTSKPLPTQFLIYFAIYIVWTLLEVIEPFLTHNVPARYKNSNREMDRGT